MAVKELILNLNPSRPKVIIKGRYDVLSKTVEGSWATLFKGRGMEFTGYRQYSYTDDASSIDWRASLRSKDLLVREYEEYKNYNVYFFLDTSNSMLFTSETYFKVEFAAHILYSIAFEASNSGDSIGIGMFNTKIKENVMPTFGKTIMSRLAKTLTNKENYGGPRDFRKSALQLSSILQIPSVVILISDFIGLPEDWDKYLELLSKTHHVIGIMIRDKRDMELPSSGQFSIKDPNSDETILFDAKQFKKEYAELSKKNQESIVKKFKRIRSDCLVLENEDKEYLDKIRKFFNKLYHIEY
jgi:uncharacterized protein (DUF58 family)